MWPYENKQIQLSTLRTAELSILWHPRYSLTETKLGNLSKRSLKVSVSNTTAQLWKFPCVKGPETHINRNWNEAFVSRQSPGGEATGASDVWWKGTGRGFLMSTYDSKASTKVLHQLRSSCTRSYAQQCFGNSTLLCAALLSVFLALHHFLSFWNVLCSENNPKVF